MSAVVSAFFAPANPKRPPNFIVLKYFLLGLLISNSIESILIIPKILDVFDQNKMQHHRIETAEIQRKEIEEIAAAREAQAKEEQRLEAKERSALLEGSKVHIKPKHGHHKEANHTPTVRKRAHREDTGTNYVSLFILFYGAITLCLGIIGLWKEIQLLIAILMGICVVGILVLMSAGFSLIMLMSVSKDTIIAILSFKYRQMIVESDALLAQEMAAAGAVAGGADYSQQQQYPQQ